MPGVRKGAAAKEAGLAEPACSPNAPKDSGRPELELGRGNDEKAVGLGSLTCGRWGGGLVEEVHVRHLNQPRAKEPRLPRNPRFRGV